ncbi:MAG: lysophospholipid acyltransferase family protein [Phycisphaerae bacterium]|nr:lysophospholipid acyltransferase family protein [Phycisphaerae bacterium]
MSPRRRGLDYLVYVAVRLATMVFHAFPINANLRTAQLLGAVWYHMPRWIPLVGRALGKHRERGESNIRLAMPELPDSEVRRICLASMQSLAMLAIEVLFTPRLITPWTWPRYVRLKNLQPVLRLLLERPGCIMVTAHYGNWELLGFMLATLGFEPVAVMRPFDNEYLNDYLMAQREPSGIQLLYKKGASRSMSDVLETRQALCFIGDQNAGSKGMFVDFFGRKASTYKSIGLLAIQHRVPIIVGYARRLGPRFEYEMSVNRIIEPHEWEGRDDELRWITQEFSSAVEAFIREAPEQYLWLHRRWKSRPKEELAAASAEPLATASAPGSAT